MTPPVDDAFLAERTNSYIAAPTDIKWVKYIPHVPHVKQHAFLWLHCLEAMFGGAAGGGKSDALLMAALQWSDTPGYAAIIFRRTFADLALPGAAMNRAQEWLSGTDAKWNDNTKTWTFPAGATLTFGYLQNTKDKFRYQSAEFQFIGFDEVTQFPEEDYKYLFSRLRRPMIPEGLVEDDSEVMTRVRALAAVPLRMRSATNPGGEGHRWVRRRFIDKEPDLDEPYYIQAAQERIFIPSLLEDNPSLDRVEYESSLKQLDPITQAQLRHGDWSIRQPGMWVFEADHIDAAEALGRTYDALLKNGELGEPHGGAMVSGMDYGDFATVGLPLWMLERGGVYVPPKEALSSREDLEEIALLQMATMGQYKFWWSEHRYDSAFAQSNRTFVKMVERHLGMHNAMRRTGRPNSLPVSFKEYKLLCIRYIRLLLANAKKATEGEMGQMRVLVISPRNTTLLDQMRDYQEDEFGKPEKGNDDAIDALIAGVQPLARQHRILLEQMQGRAKDKKPTLKLQPTGTPENRKLLKGQRA